LRCPYPQVVRLVQPGNKFRPVPGGRTRSKVVTLSRKDTNVVSQQMQGDVLDGPGRAGGGLLPILFTQAREESLELSQSRPEEIDDDDRASRVQVTSSSASSRGLPFSATIAPSAQRLGAERPAPARSLGRLAFMPGRSSGLLDVGCPQWRLAFTVFAPAGSRPSRWR